MKCLLVSHVFAVIYLSYGVGRALIIIFHFDRRFRNKYVFAKASHVIWVKNYFSCISAAIAMFITFMACRFLYGSELFHLANSSAEFIWYFFPRFQMFKTINDPLDQ